MAAAASTINISGPQQTAYANIPLNITVPIAAPLGAVTVVTLASGFNSIAVPTGATAVIIQFNPANTQTATLKGITGDTGLLLNKTGVNVIQLDPTVTAIGITAGALFTTVTIIQFY